MSAHWERSGAALTAAVAAGETSAREIVEAHLARIDAVNPAVNAVVVVRREEALAEADALDRSRAAGRPAGSLEGVPVTVKENIDVAGGATTQGIPLLAEAIAPGDAPVVERLRAAGAIVIGRANMADLGMRLHTESHIHGATINPWDADRSPGGSSGGDAAAVAAGMAVLGIGGDFGGSLRLPARNCGVVSIKPTLWQVPRASTISDEGDGIVGQLFSVTGPIARTIDDLRRAFTVMAGRHPRDPWSEPRASAELPLGPVRVAVVADPDGLGDVHPAVLESVQLAADALADAGYDVVEAVDPPSALEAATLGLRLSWAEVRPDLDEMVEAMCATGGRYLRLIAEQVEEVDLAGHQRDLAARHAMARRWSLFMADHPLILAPVSTALPAKVGSDIVDVATQAEGIRAGRMLNPVNMLGLPGVAVPTGERDGLPQGVQLIGRRYDDYLCLAAAEAIEARRGTLAPIAPR